MSVEARDHAYPNGGGVSAAAAAPGGMTNGEKVAVSDVVQSDEAKGAPVHAFDPDAEPAEKAALAGAARAQLDALPKLGRRKAQEEADAGLALGVDTSGLHGKGTVPVPTVTVSDADATSRGEGQIAGADALPGSIPTGAAPAVPTWMQTGWRQVAGIDPTAMMDPRKQADAGILADYLSEQMYGSWYHNAGIIVFAVFATRFITSIGLGFAWILIILAFCAAYYSLSIRRTRQRARDDIQRELVKTRLVTETESADWLNGFLDRFWLIYEPVLSQTIVASVDSVLASSTPAFLESIRMTTFTLGTKAPRIDFVRTFPKTYVVVNFELTIRPEDIVIMDWALSFTPNDLMDITPRQAQKRVNPKIVLSIRVGKAGISKSLPILLEDMSFTGKMRIKMKLMTNFPHVKAIDMSFIEKPTFDYVLKPIGGDTFGFDINNIPGLAPFIREQVHANLGPMMYDPNSLTIDLESLLSGTPLDSAIGVLKVTIIDARGLKAVKFGGGDPDPYVTIALGAKPVICKTKMVASTANPTWHDTQFILVNTLADVLNLGLWDYNEHRADNQLGTVSQELNILAEDAEKEGLVSKIISGGKDRGELRYDLSFFPVLQPSKNPDGTFEPPPVTSTGIVRLTLHQAKDLDITRAHGDLNPFARVFLGASKQPVHKTPILKRQNQPIWESHCEFLVPDKQSSVITIEVIDSKDFASDPTLGRITVKLSDLLELKQRGQDWLPMQNSRAGKIRLTADWKPVGMTGSVSGAAAYVPPIGMLRVWLRKAVDVKNVEAGLGGKSDPYVRIMGNNKVLARTDVRNNNLNPEWDQIVYVPVHNLRENLVLEVMDFQNIGKDRSLGYVELKVADCAEVNQGSNATVYPFSSKGHQVRSDKIKLDKANTYKGTLMYEVDFKPAMSLRGGVSFEAEANELEDAAREKAEGSSQASVVAGKGEGSIRTIKTQASKSSLVGSIRPVPTIPEGDISLSRVNGNEPGTNHAESRGGGEATAAEDPQVGAVLGREELLAKQSGILVIQLISGSLSHKGTVEILIDDGYWPSFTSTKSRSTHQKWDQIGEGFVRELDLGSVCLRVNAHDDAEKEEIVAEYRCETKTFLETCLNQPTDFELHRSDGMNRCVLRLNARFVPVDIKLEPRESLNDMGALVCEVIRAKNLLAVDRSGKSDPNVTFTLNGIKVFKSETKKKTLNPEWNETFDVKVPSRVAAKFEFEIHDWDRVGTADSLGGGRIDLASLEPFTSTDLTIPVRHEKKGEHGSMVIRVMFQPEVIVPTRNKTSTFSTAGRAITTVGGLPIAAGKGVIHGGGAVAMGVGRGAIGVGRGVGSVGGFAGRKIGLIKKKDKHGREILVHPDDVGADGEFEGPSEPAAQVDGFVTGEVSGSGRPTEAGTLVVTVLGGSDIKSEEGSKLKSYVAVKVGGKSHKTDHVKGVEPEWNEHLSFPVTPDITSLSLALHEHHSFGRDPVIGEAEVNIWQHINTTATAADITVPLTSDVGSIKLRLDWATGPPAIPSTSGGLLSRRRSISSGMNVEGGNSPGRLGGLRMSMARKEREKTEDI